MGASLQPASIATAAARVQLQQPEIAAFGEWDTANLGDRGIHEGVMRFFGDCGWAVSSYGFSSLAPVAADAAQQDTPLPAAGRLRAVLGRAPVLKRALRGARQRARMAALAPALAPASAILVGGGALLSDEGLHFPQSLVELARCARGLGKPLLCLGCSAEGEWSPLGRRMIRDFLSACTVIAVRDEATAARLAPVLGVPPPVFGDFCLSEALVHDREEHGHPRRGIGINVCQLPVPWAAAQERYEEALVALANRLARGAADGGAGIRIFTTGLPEDARAAERVYTRVEAPGVELQLPRNLPQISAMLGTNAVAVATRLHAAVLALAEGVPIAGFSVTPKLRDFLATLGMARYYHDISEGARLAERLAVADCSFMLAEQRGALTRAPVWAGRERVRGELALLAGGYRCR